MNRVLYTVICATIYLETLRASTDQLNIEITQKVENCDRKTKDGDLLTIHYSGRLASDGKQFDSSYERGQPFSFQLGKKYVIPGWEQGVQDMCAGEKRTLHIPSHLGYGEMGAGEHIPPNANLIFDVELIKIEEAPPQTNVFKEIDTDKDGQLSREEVGDYLKKQIPENMKDTEDVASFDGDKMVEEIFHHEDKDKNGFISHNEFTGPKHDEL